MPQSPECGNTLVPNLEVVLLPAVTLFTLDPGLGCGVSLTLWTACSSMGKLSHRWVKKFCWKSWTSVLSNNSNTYSKLQALNQAPYLNYLVSSSLKTLWVRGYNIVPFYIGGKNWDSDDDLVKGHTNCTSKYWDFNPNAGHVPGSPVVKPLCSTAESTHSIPGWGTKILHVMWHSTPPQKKKIQVLWLHSPHS